MDNAITKKALRQRLGVKNDAELARFFKITRSSVSEWGEDSAVPEKRILQAVCKKPSAFPEFLEAAANDGSTEQGDSPGVG